MFEWLMFLQKEVLAVIFTEFKKRKFWTGNQNVKNEHIHNNIYITLITTNFWAF